ncbi:MAG: nitronate monooxygenase [Acidimicrobiia bacterium]|nr:nitronate monooxygenase [Acidimicrobiia bacterium]
MAHAALHTRFCDLVGCELPIVQTGMGWVSGVSLTSATAQAGALGILASATMTPEELDRAIGEIRDRTERPFGVNLLPGQPDTDARVEVMLRHGVEVASFAQAPGEALVKTLKDAGVVCIPTIGAPRHAEKVAAWGVDAVIAQGAEGGGHTGTVPTSLLVPLVADTVDIPIVAAGGFFDGRGLVAALAYGADGIAMGTRFLLTRESRVPDNVKDVYLGTGLAGTVVTEAIDGAPQRVIRTRLIESLERASVVTRLPRAAANALRFRRQTGTGLGPLVRSGLAMRRDQDLTWSQVALAANAPMLTRESMVEGHTEVGILPTGQVVGAIDALPSVGELVRGIMREAEDTLGRLSGTADSEVIPSVP